MAKKKQNSIRENSAPASQVPNPGTLPPEQGADPAAHADVDQDKALIKQMLKDTFGDDVANDQEACEMAHGMYSSSKGAGDTHEEAMNCAKYGMKAAKHKAEKEAVAAKSVTDGGGQEAASAESTETTVDESTVAPKPVESSAPSADEVKSLRETVARLTAENVKFKTDQEKGKIADHLEKVCSESRRPKKVTNAFRDLVKNAKSTKEIDDTWKIFNEALEGSGSEPSEGEGFSYALTEKAAHIDAPGGKAVDFSDCLNN